MEGIKRTMLELDKELSEVGYQSIRHDQIIEELKELANIINTVNESK